MRSKILPSTNFFSLKPFRYPALPSSSLQGLFDIVMPNNNSTNLELKNPPQVHFFLWLLSQNKVLARDNLEKRKSTEDKTCLSWILCHTACFCYSVLAKQLWTVISQLLEVKIGDTFDSIGGLWLNNKKHLVHSCIIEAFLYMEFMKT